MKIILNKRLRNIKALLKRDSITYPDFVLNNELLKHINNDMEGLNIIKAISNKEITEDYYNFLLGIYSDNKNTFNKLSNHLTGYNLDDLKYVYSLSSELFNTLLDYPKLLKKEIVDFYGINLLLSNKNLLDELYDLPISEIEPYIDKLKSSPQNLSVFLDIKNNYKMNPEMQTIYNYLDKPNLKEFFVIFKTIEDPLLRNYAIINYGNTDVLEFVKTINGKISKISYDYKDYYNQIKKQASNISENIIKQFIVYVFRDNYKNKKNIISLLLQALLNNKNAFSLKYQVININSDNPEFNKEKEKILLAHKLMKLPEEELFANFEMHYFAEDLFVNYDIVFNTIRDYNANLMKEKLTNIDNLKVVDNMEYKYIDEFGNEITKTIPVKVIDDPDFRVLIHGIAPKNRNRELSESDTNLYGESLMNNPKLWYSLGPKVGNPQISVSYFHGCLNPFVSNLILGFTDFSNERLISSNPNDGATSMKKSIKDMLADNDNISFTSFENLDTSIHYNEVLLQRFYNDKPLIPNFIILDNIKKTESVESSKKWATYYNIPIVIIDKKAIGEKRKVYLNNLVNKIIENNCLTQDLLEELILEISRTLWCYRFDVENNIDVYAIIKKLIDNLSNTLENIVNIIKLLENFYFISNVYKNIEFPNENSILNYSVGPLDRFKPSNIKNEDNEVSKKIAEERQKEMSAYLEKFKEYYKTFQDVEMNQSVHVK